MNTPRTALDRLNQRIRDNPVLALLILLGSVVVGLSAFTNAARNLMSMVYTQERPAVNGDWTAEVDYPWAAHHRETFRFFGEGEVLRGSASFLGQPRGIVKGRVNAEGLEFITRTQALAGGVEQPLEHHYYGAVTPSGIRFYLQTNGNGGATVPIEFVATPTQQ